MVIPVCKPCHRILTNWGQAAGLYDTDGSDQEAVTVPAPAELGPETVVTATDRDEARVMALIGLGHVWALTALMTGRRIRATTDLGNRPNSRRTMEVQP